MNYELNTSRMVQQIIDHSTNNLHDNSNDNEPQEHVKSHDSLIDCEMNIEHFDTNSKGYHNNNKINDFEGCENITYVYYKKE